MKKSFLVASLFVAAVMSSQASIVLYAEYHLGENGSLGTNNRPLDSAIANGAQDFTGDTSGGTATVSSSGVFAPDSTAYLDTSGVGNEGWSGADFSTLPTTNFALGIYVRAASNTTATQGDIFTLGGNGAPEIMLTTNGWGAAVRNQAWISQVSGVTGSFTADQWVHLAVIRTATTTTFYIDSVSKGSVSNALTLGTAVMSMAPGNTAYFDGNLDEARVVTFDAGESTTNILNALQAVPEPSTALLGGFGLLGLLTSRRRRA